MRKRTKRRIIHGVWILMILIAIIAAYASFIIVEDLSVALLFFSLFVVICLLYASFEKRNNK